MSHTNLSMCLIFCVFKKMHVEYKSSIELYIKNKYIHFSNVYGKLTTIICSYIGTIIFGLGVLLCSHHNGKYMSLMG